LGIGHVKCERRIDVLKKLVYLTGVLVALAFIFTGLALAQAPSPTATIHQQHLTGSGVENSNKPSVPSILFYGGDGDPNNAEADGLWTNRSTSIGLFGQVFSPFMIPKTNKWNVSSLFTNVEYFPFPPVVDAAEWQVISITTNNNTVPPTVVGTIVCSGVDAVPILTDTGRLYFGFYEEFTTAVAVAGCDLKGGSKGSTYWESVTPDTGATGIFQLAYESNVPDSTPPNAIGTPEPVDQSYFYGPQFGVTTLQNANTQGPFHVFSAGVAGSSSK